MSHDATVSSRLLWSCSRMRGKRCSFNLFDFWHQSRAKGLLSRPQLFATQAMASHWEAFARALCCVEEVFDLCEILVARGWLSKSKRVGRHDAAQVQLFARSTRAKAVKSCYRGASRRSATPQERPTTKGPRKSGLRYALHKIDSTVSCKSVTQSETPDVRRTVVVLPLFHILAKRNVLVSLVAVLRRILCAGRRIPRGNSNRSGWHGIHWLRWRVRSQSYFSRG